MIGSRARNVLGCLPMIGLMAFQRSDTIFEIDGADLENMGGVDGDYPTLIVSSVEGAKAGTVRKVRATARAKVGDNVMPAQPFKVTKDANGTIIGVKPQQTGGYLGVAFTVSGAALIDVTQIDINGNDLVLTKSTATTSDNNVVSLSGAILLGASSKPATYFAYFKRDSRQPRELSSSDSVNITVTNLDTVNASYMNVRIVHAPPADAIALN